jgi:outer membrane protein assembly factor BamB
MHLRWNLSWLCTAGLLLPSSLLHAAPTEPDDSPAARTAAVARLRAAPAGGTCADPGAMSRTYGTSCAAREFPAPPLLAAPQLAWEAKPGWWGVWSPFLVGELMLTGSCNNDGNAGLSALDMRNGKTVWRIGEICSVGHRRGTPGIVAFHELPSGEVLMIYPRSNGEPTDHYVIDVKAGRIVRSLKPAIRATLRGHGGSFTAVSQSRQDGFSTLSGLDPTLEQVLWRNTGFRLAMRDDDPHYMPTFSPPAVANGMLFMTARSLEQPEPPTRQLHAIDLRTGQTLWRHTEQPEVERSNAGPWRSDDGTPMVAGGLVIIRVQGLLGAVAQGRRPEGDALRALDARTGAVRWTTTPTAGQTFINRVAAGGVLVAEVERDGARAWWGYRLADGTPVWRRPVAREARLLASAGGVVYAAERIPDARGDGKDYRLQGIAADSGTLLWTTVLPGRNNLFDEAWGIQDARAGASQGPQWRIGRDGAIYGVTLTGAYKLQAP